MKKVISAVLTAAMVVGMGVSVLAATPSKTVADEVKASGSATVTGVLGIVSDVKLRSVPGSGFPAEAAVLRAPPAEASAYADASRRAPVR